MRPLGSAFAAAQDSQVTLGLKKQVQELQKEIEELRSQVSTGSSSEDRQVLEEKIEELTRQLAEEGIHRIPIDKILPDPNQPRTIFPVEVVNARAESLRKEGQLAPIIVIPMDDGNYRLFEGQLRWTAAPLAGITHLNAVFREPEDSISTFDRQLTTSIQSEKLHELDLARALIKLCQFHRPDLSEQSIIGSVNKALKTFSKQGKSSELSALRTDTQEKQENWLRQQEELEEDQRFILKIILGKALNPASVYANCLPLLKLPEDLQTAIGQGMEASKARELGKVTASKLGVSDDEALKLRQELIEKTLDEGWPLTVVREKVKAVISRSSRTSAVQRPARQILEKVQAAVAPLSTLDVDPAQDRDVLLELEASLKEQLEQVRKILGS